MANAIPTVRNVMEAKILSVKNVLKVIFSKVQPALIHVRQVSILILQLRPALFVTQLV